MIVVQLNGGLGNQMFQYATARALAVRRGAELVLDSSWLEGRGGSTRSQVRTYELGCFELAAPLVRVERVALLPGMRWARVRRRLPRRRPYLRELVEPPFGRPVSSLVDMPDDTYLRGYWQNPSYFEDAEPLIRRDFTFRPAVVEQGSRLTETVHSTPLPVVSVHVRRADYVTDPGVRERLGPLGPEYYDRAVNEVTSRVGAVRLLVFSDDPEWCGGALRFGHETRIVRGDAGSPARDMYLMSLCDHHVIANSSFSWWGAWLNPAPDKIVVAPKPWYLAEGKPDTHRFPPGWIRVERDGYQEDQPPSTTTFEPVT